MSFLSVFDKYGFKFEIFFRYVRFSSVEGTLDRSNANIAKKKKKKWIAMHLVREERFVESILIEIGIQIHLNLRILITLTNNALNLMFTKQNTFKL